jgi:hypothetical protein
MTDTTPAAVDKYTSMQVMQSFPAYAAWVRHSDYAALSSQLEAAKEQLAEEIRVSTLRGNHIEFDLLPQMADLEMLSKTAHANGKAEGLREADMWKQRAIHQNSVANAEHTRGKAEGLREALDYLIAVGIAGDHHTDPLNQQILALIPADTPDKALRDACKMALSTSSAALAQLKEPK